MYATVVRSLVVYATRVDRPTRRSAPSVIRAGIVTRSRHRIRDLKLPFSLFLALRYLKPKRTFVSIITLISVPGVTLGVTV